MAKEKKYNIRYRYWDTRGSYPVPAWGECTYEGKLENFQEWAERELNIDVEGVSGWREIK